jgi:hypothetical protein
MYMNIIHHKIIHRIIPLTTLVLKYICNFQILRCVLFCHKYIPYVQIFSLFIEFLKKLIILSLKLIKYTFNFFFNPICDVHTLPKKIIAKILCL